MKTDKTPIAITQRWIERSLRILCIHLARIDEPYRVRFPLCQRLAWQKQIQLFLCTFTSHDTYLCAVFSSGIRFVDVLKSVPKRTLLLRIIFQNGKKVLVDFAQTRRTPNEYWTRGERRESGFFYMSLDKQFRTIFHKSKVACVYWKCSLLFCRHSVCSIEPLTHCYRIWISLFGYP